MKKVLLSALALAGISLAGWAQDVHFTQYFTSPLTLNPVRPALRKTTGAYPLTFVHSGILFPVTRT